MSEYIISDRQLGLIQDFANVCIEGEKLPRIVRCRDCRWLWGTDKLCMLPDGNGDYLRIYVQPDDYCAWGERRA